MGLNERIGRAFKDIKGVLWIIVVPVFLDLISLYTYVHFLKGEYVGIDKIFIIKLGAISAPPSVGYILENFPAILFKYNTAYGATGLVMSLSIFNVLLILSVNLIESYLKSGYMGCLEVAGRRTVSPFEFFSLASRNWFDFFILQLINSFIMFLGIMSNFFVVAIIFSMLLFYAEYSIVVDKKGIIKTLGHSVSMLLNYLGKSIGMGLYYGFLMSLCSPFVFPLSRGGYGGIVFAIIIVNFFGISVNKAVLELYRDMTEGRFLESVDVSGEEQVNSNEHHEYSELS